MITLYTTRCPKCLMLEDRLNDNQIDYNVVDDKTIMSVMHIDKVPMLDVDGTLMDYRAAMAWLKERELNG